MKRLTMSLDDDLADAFEALVRSRGYENRSEAFRDLLRQDLSNVRLRDRPDEPCVATLSYVYNHPQRQVAARLADFEGDYYQPWQAVGAGDKRRGWVPGPAAPREQSPAVARR